MNTNASPGHRLLRASAGTGKTYQLVEAYVRCIDVDKLRPAQIVAITFTRKAAAELRLRVRAKLLALGAQASVLAELARAPLGNFHGLALQLMGSFGLDAGMTGPLRVLAEAQEDRALFREACRDVWFAGDKAAADAVSLVAPYLKVGDTLPEALWQAIALAREDDVPVGPDLLGQIDAGACLRQLHGAFLRLREEILESDVAMTSMAEESLALFKAAPLPDCPQVGSTVPQDVEGIEALADSLAPWQKAWDDLFRLLNVRTSIKKIYTKEQRAWVKSGLAEIEADVLCACLTPAVAVLLEHAWRGYTRLKQERGVVDFVDIITRLNYLLETRDDLRASLRARFGAILVDEAQDTNRLQRRMVDLLCGFSHNDGDEPESQACVFVVGDWKQSIYTFRGADPKSFDDFAEAVKARGGTETTLSISRRSAPELVHGINSLGVSLFGARYEALDVLDAQSPDADASNDGPTAGACWLSLPAGDKAGTDKPVTVDPMFEAQSLALWVKERIAQGAEPGDFAILLSAMTAAPTFLGALQRMGIPALLGGGGGLYKQAEILDHLALLAWLADAEAHLQAAVCLRAPLFGLSDSALWALFGPEGRALDRLGALRRGVWQMPDPASLDAAALCAEDIEALTAAADALPKLVAAAESLGVGLLLERIDQTLDTRAVYLGLDSGPQRVANIQRLWRFGHAHDKAFGPSLSRFVMAQFQKVDDAFKEPLASVPTAGRVAVTISTVHQSKGLQYPIVVLPRLTSGGRPNVDAVVYDRQEGIVFRPKRRQNTMKSGSWRRAQESGKEAEDAERRRLLYVAMTRAESELVFIGPPPANLGKANFGTVLKAWGATSPQTLRFVEAPVPTPDARVAAPLPLVLDVPDAAPPTIRPAAPGTHFRVTVTALAHAEVGAPPAVLADEVLETEQEQSENVVAPEVTQASVLSLAATDAPLSPSIKGELAHGVLANIGALPEYDTEGHFIADMLGRFGYGPDDARVDDVRRNVLAFLRSALGRHIAHLPNEARRHEMPFQLVLPCGPYAATLHGQLDLAYWDEAGLTIVDYKHARPGTHDEGYLRQLDAYAYALAQLCHIRGDIKCYLVYLRGTTPPVQHIVTQARQEALEGRLTELVSAWAQASVGAPSAA